MSAGEQVTKTEPLPNEPMRTKRAIGVDVARAIALIGMIAVHVYGESPEAEEPGVGWAFAIFGGRAAALFALLAGVSIAFVERRSRGQLFGRNLAADRAALVVRGLLILLVGLLLGHLEWPIFTIIPYFGILFLLAVPFYGRPSMFLLIAAPLLAILGPVLRHLYAGTIPPRPDPTDDYTLVTAVKYPGHFIADMLLTGFYPAVMWMAYICVGIVIGRQVLNSRKLAFVLLGAGAVLAVATWVMSKVLLGPAGGLQRLIEATPGMTREDIEQRLLLGPDGILMPDTTWWWLAAISPYSSTPLNILHNLGAAVGALGLVLLLTHAGGKIFSPFAAIGAMTLTLYSAHCILLAVEVLDVERPLVSLWIQIIAFMLFALMWRSTLGKGPLESIISEASDWTRTRILTPREKPALWRRKHPERVRSAPPAPSLEKDLSAKVRHPSRNQ